MNGHKKGGIDQSDGVPAHLAVFINTIFEQNALRVRKHPDRSVEANAMLFSVGCVFLFVPLESHSIPSVIHNVLRHRETARSRATPPA